MPGGWIRLARCRGPALVLAGVAASVGVWNLVLLAALGYSTRWLGSEFEGGIWDRVEPGAKVSGVTDQVRRGVLPGGTKLGVILGQSTARFGLVPSVFEASFGPPYRWLGLSGYGGGINRIADLARLLALLRPRPSVVLIAVHPYMIATSPPPSPVGPADLFRAVGDRRWDRARREASSVVRYWFWIGSNRSRFHYLAQQACLEARVALLVRTADVPTSALFPPSDDPWATPQFEVVEGPTPDGLRNQLDPAAILRKFAEIGRFDPANYLKDAGPASATVRLIQIGRGLGADVGVVFMPEISTLRKAIPPEAEQTFRAILEENFPDAPPIFDMTDALPDSQFQDNLHLTPAGAMEFSARLAPQVRDRFVDRTPPQPPRPVDRRLRRPPAVDALISTPIPLRERLPGHFSEETKVSSEPRVHRFALQGQHAEDALMDPPQRLPAHEPLQALDAQGELTQGQRPLPPEAP